MKINNHFKVLQCIVKLTAAPSKYSEPHLFNKIINTHQYFNSTAYQIKKFSIFFMIIFPLLKYPPHLYH